MVTAWVRPLERSQLTSSSWSGAGAEFSGCALGGGGPYPCAHHDGARCGVHGSGDRQGTFWGRHRILQRSAVVRPAGHPHPPPPPAKLLLRGQTLDGSTVLSCSLPTPPTEAEKFPGSPPCFSFLKQPLQANTTSSCRTAKLTASGTPNQACRRALHLERIISKLGKEHAEEREESK